MGVHYKWGRFPRVVLAHVCIIDLCGRVVLCGYAGGASVVRSCGPSCGAGRVLSSCVWLVFLCLNRSGRRCLSSSRVRLYRFLQAVRCPSRRAAVILRDSSVRTHCPSCRTAPAGGLPLGAFSISFIERKQFLGCERLVVRPH